MFHLGYAIVGAIWICKVLVVIWAFDRLLLYTLFYPQTLIRGLFISAQLWSKASLKKTSDFYDASPSIFELGEREKAYLKYVRVAGDNRGGGSPFRNFNAN